MKDLSPWFWILSMSPFVGRLVSHRKVLGHLAVPFSDEDTQQVWVLFVSLAVMLSGPPGAPVGVLVGDVTDRNAQLSWGPGPDNHSPVTLYIVQARTPFSIGWQAVKTGIGLCILSYWIWVHYRILLQEATVHVLFTVNLLWPLTKKYSVKKKDLNFNGKNYTNATIKTC